MIHLFAIGFGRPDLLVDQKRLLDKYLEEPFRLHLLDNTPAPGGKLLQDAAASCGVIYQGVHSDKHEHNDALNLAAMLANEREYEFWMTLDHDVFPRRKTTLISKIKVAGFYGIGQFHHPTQTRYLWPGFCGFSREWLGGRIPNFNGIRGVDKRDDGDCGSMLGPLFTDDDWDRLPRTDHGYRVIRPEDEFGLQSFGIEFFDDFIHLTNSSHWMAVPEPEERDRILNELVQCL